MMSSGHPETRKAILEAARELLQDLGSGDVRVEDVAREAGVSRQAVYLHFGSRSGLLVALARHLDEAEGFFERSSCARHAGSGLEALERFLDFWGDYVPRIQAAAREIESAQYRDEAAAAAWNDRMRGLQRTCHFLIKWLERDGILAPPWTVDEGAEMLWALISIHTWRDLTLGRRWSRKRYVERMRLVLRRTFVQGGGSHHEEGSHRGRGTALQSPSNYSAV